MEGKQNGEKKKRKEKSERKKKGKEKGKRSLVNGWTTWYVRDCRTNNRTSNP